MKRWLIAAVTLILDQLTKAWVIHSVEPADSIPLLPPILHLTYVQNTGAAFGLFKGSGMLLIVLSIGVAAWITGVFLRGGPSHRLSRWGCALILGGAVGNLIDRLRFGYVVDFFDLRVWPVFNVADSAITIGAALIVWLSVRRHPGGTA